MVICNLDLVSVWLWRCDYKAGVCLVRDGGMCQEVRPKALRNKLRTLLVNICVDVPCCMVLLRVKEPR